MKTNSDNYENKNLEQLLVKLKKEDASYANISKAITIIYGIFVPLYTVLTILRYTESQSTDDIISGSCFVLSFLILTFFFRKYYKEYKYVDYSLPTIQMLKKAAWRYKPFQLRSIWILFALVLLDIGLTFNWMDEYISVMTIQVIFLGLISLGVIIGLILWYFKYKPIRDEALQLIKEIEGE